MLGNGILHWKVGILFPQINILVNDIDHKYLTAYGQTTAKTIDYRENRKLHNLWEKTSHSMIYSLVSVKSTVQHRYNHTANNTNLWYHTSNAEIFRVVYAGKICSCKHPNATD